METIETLDPTPFKHLVMSIGALPTSFVDGMSYYECMAWLVAYIRDKVVPACNNNAEAIKEIQKWIETLDLQDEVDNKLDEMAASGQLAEIISQYLNSTAIFCYDTVADMKAATNLINGSYARTLGRNNKNDNGGGLYKIRNVTNDDVVNEIAIIEMADSANELVAEYIPEGNINLNALGVATTTADNSTIINYAISYFKEGSKFVLYPNGDYTCLSAIDFQNKEFTISGSSAPVYDQASNSSLVFPSSNGFVNGRKAVLENLSIKGNTTTPANSGTVENITIRNCIISYFNVAINANYKQVFVSNTHIHHNNIGVLNPVDGRIINCTINDNTSHGINLMQGANDNIISNNKIEWNGGNGIILYNTNYNTIDSNIIDRSGKEGLYLSGSGCGYNTINDNILKRNGATTSTGTEKANIRLNAVSGKNLIANNFTCVGNSMDDGSGTNVPLYALIVMETADTVYLNNNNLTGGTNTNPIYRQNSPKVMILDREHPTYDNLMISTSNVSVEANGTGSTVIPFEITPADYSQGYYKKIVAQARTASDSVYAIGTTYVKFYKQYGVLKAMLTDTTVGSYLTMSVAYDSEQGVVLTFTNSSAGQFNVKVDVYNS